MRDKPPAQAECIFVPVGTVCLQREVRQGEEREGGIQYMGMPTMVMRVQPVASARAWTISKRAFTIFSPPPR
jgi:hypothetical protein